METLTVGELIEELKLKDKSLPVFMITDRTKNNWDEEYERFIIAHPIGYVGEECICSNDGWENEDDRNILLMIPEE